MDYQNDKSRVWKLAGAFFGAMILFTLLSRAVYQHGTAVVTTSIPSSGVVTHSVRLTGKAVQNQDMAVTTVGGLRVGSVLVNEGQQVHAGDVLFTLDLDYLTEEIEDQKREMEKQKLSIQDAWSQNYAADQRRSNQQAQAEENYAVATSQAETTLERAERTLERAKKALEDFYNGVTQEETLREAVEQAEADYQAAQAALTQLEEEIEAKVREAVEQAKQEAAQPLPSPTEPLPSGTEPLPTAPETVPAETGGAPSDAPTVPAAEPLRSGNGELRLVLLSAVSAPDLEGVEAAVRETYAQRLADARAAVEQAKTAVEEAEMELANCLDGTGPSEQELLTNVEKAQESYDDALAALNNAKTTYGRAIRSAELPDGSNHAAQIAQLSYDQMAQSLEKLETLLEEEGQIRAPVDGVVTRCHVQTGEKTTDTTAVLLADLSQGCKFSGSITEEQSKYIGVGDLVTLQAAGGGKRYSDLPVTLLTPDEDGMYQLLVQLPADTLALGASAELTYTRRSQPYSCCIPLSALHLDEKNQPYVLVAEEVKTVLGTQTQAQKVPVTVLEQNDATAALTDGALHQKQQVIVGADRAVDAGSRVRVG